MVKNKSAMLETLAQQLGWDDTPENGMATTPEFCPGNHMDIGA